MSSHIASWPSQAEDWLDSYGKPAWIAAMVLGFILFWPVGLALLFYMIWGKNMFKGSCAKRRDRNRGFSASGNSAFDAYKSDTLRRLEEEQSAFDGFLQRLRESRDKSEFDAFMNERERVRADQRPPEPRDSYPPQQSA